MLLGDYKETLNEEDERSFDASIAREACMAAGLDLEWRMLKATNSMPCAELILYEVGQMVLLLRHDSRGTRNSEFTITF